MTSRATVTVAAIGETIRAEWCHHRVIFAGITRRAAHRGKIRRELWHNQGGLARRALSDFGAERNYRERTLNFSATILRIRVQT